jgi:isoleucyl-tRNA synthetase
MPMTELIPFKVGNSVTIWRTEDKQEEILIGSVEELYNEIENHRCWCFKKILLGFEVGIWTKATYDLIDLHKNVVDEILSFCIRKTNDARS